MLSHEDHFGKALLTPGALDGIGFSLKADFRGVAVFHSFVSYLVLVQLSFCQLRLHMLVSVC